MLFFFHKCRVTLLLTVIVFLQQHNLIVLAHLGNEYYSSGAERFFSILDIPAECTVNAMRDKEEPLTAKQKSLLDAVARSFGKGRSRSLVKLSEQQMLWFVTQGAQADRVVTSKQKEKRYVLQDQIRNLIKQRTDPLPVRKELRMMTQKEWGDFVEAVIAMRSSFPESNNGAFDKNYPASEYDILVAFHNGANAPSAHNGPAFSPWHREYLLRFETALRKHVPNAVLPYWDSSLDSSLPFPEHSVIWTDELLGNCDGPVTSGPFKHFSVLGLNDEECTSIGENVTRTATLFGNFLYNQLKFQELFSKETFGEYETGHENLHNGVHAYFMGHMFNVPCSPVDPVFLLHHSFVDSLWEEFRRNHQITDPEIDYPSDTFPGHGPYDPMSPFEPKYNIEGLSNDYTNYRYKYADRPSKGFCTSDAACGSPYLWCDTDRCRCTSKIREAGICGDLPDRACYCPGGLAGECANQQCQCVRP